MLFLFFSSFSTAQVLQFALTTFLDSHAFHTHTHTDPKFNPVGSSSGYITFSTAIFHSQATGPGKGPSRWPICARETVENAIRVGPGTT